MNTLGSRPLRVSSFDETYFQKIILSIVIVFCLLYELVEGVFLRTTEIEKVIFAVFCIVTLFLGMLRFASAWSDYSKNRYILCVIAVGLLFAIYPLFNGIQNFYYYIRDLITYALLGASFCLVGSQSILQVPKTWKVTVYCLLVITVIAFLLSLTLSISGSRFEPPELVIIPFLVFLLRSDRNIIRWGWYFALIFLCITLAYFSLQRTSLILVVASFFLSFSFYEVNKFRRFFYFILGCMSVVVLSFLLDLDLVFTGTRFEKILLGSVDGSLLARFYEVVDVYYSWLGSSLYEKLFGSGAGALYPVELIENDKMLVSTSEGYLRHHVHSTPAGLLLRCGIVGFLAYVLFSCVQIFSVFLGRSYSSAFDAFVSLSLALYLISGFLFYIPADPIFWILLSCKLGVYTQNNLR